MLFCQLQLSHVQTFINCKDSLHTGNTIYDQRNKGCYSGYLPADELLAESLQLAEEAVL